MTKCESCQLVIENQQIEGPKNSGEFMCWFKEMQRWRDNERKTINYSDYNYQKQEFITRSVIVGQSLRYKYCSQCSLMVWD